MMRLANGETDPANGAASCQSIKNSSEDLEMYYIAVCIPFNLFHIIVILLLVIQHIPSLLHGNCLVSSHNAEGVRCVTRPNNGCEGDQHTTKLFALINFSVYHLTIRYVARLSDTYLLDVIVIHINVHVCSFFFQKMRELILTSSVKVRKEAENDMLTKTLG